MRNNRFEAAVTAEGPFTNSVESCNTPAFNLAGLTKEACGSTPAPTPTPSPTPSPTATPAPTTTPAPTPTADTQAPSVPQGMGWTTKTTSSIGVRWDAATDNRGVAGYRVYRNDAVIATTTNLAATVAGLTCGTSYSIALSAFDAAGNESARAEATGTTSTEACPPVATPTPSPTPTATPTPAPTVTPSADLVGAWNFNETSGSARDASTFGNHGALSGAARVTTGKFGGALQFDGVNDYVGVPDSASLDLTKGMTIEAWVNPARLTDHRTIAFKEHRAAWHQAYSLYASEGTSRPSAEIGVGSSYSAQTSSQTIPANAWTHVAATYDGTTLRVYRNGVQVGTRTLAGSLTTTNDPLKFGGNGVWSEWFDGRLDEIRVWKVARTAAQVQTDMNTPIS